MKKFLKVTVVAFGIIFLNGCASLGKVAQEIQEIDASKEIAAVSTLAGDFVNQPWDNILQVGVGYALALLRRKYKKSKGAK